METSKFKHQTSRNVASTKFQDQSDTERQALGSAEGEHRTLKSDDRDPPKAMRPLAKCLRRKGFPLEFIDYAAQLFTGGSGELWWLSSPPVE
jgi:hypothetical protein